MAKKTKTPVNPIDVEIMEEMQKEPTSNEPRMNLERNTKGTQKEHDPEESKKNDFNGDDFEIPEDETPEANPFENSPKEESVKEIRLPQRYILSECVYKPTNPDRGEYDYSDFLIDLETIGAIERIYPERLSDFGVPESDIEENNLLESCIIFSSAFAEEIIVLDFTFEELIQNLIDYRGSL